MSIYSNTYDLDEDRLEVLCGRLCFLIFCLASFVRVCFYIFPKDFWIDEAMIAVAIDRASWSEILRGQLIYYQSCPILFAIYNKILNVYTNYSPHILYFMPTVAGIFLLLSLIKLCKCYEKSNLLALICIIIIASSRLPLYYSLEFKQYIFEGLVSTCILITFISDIRKKNKDFILSYKYPAIFGISIFISSPSIFISSSVFLAGFLYLLKNTELNVSQIIKLLIARYVALIIIYILYYILYLDNKETIQYMHKYWNIGFIPHDITLWPKYLKNTIWPIWNWMFTISPKTFRNNFESIIFATLMLFSFLSGTYFLYKRNKYAFLACFLIFVFAVIAAYGFYPLGRPYSMIGARLLFYLLPVIVFISSVGLYNILNKLIKYRKIIYCILMSGFCLVLYTNIKYVYTTLDASQSFALFDKINEENNNSDLVLIYSLTEPALKYWEITNNKKFDYKILQQSLFKRKNINVTDIESSLPDKISLYDRIFVVYAHIITHNESKIMKQIFEKNGYNVETLNATGAVLQKAVRNN